MLLFSERSQFITGNNLRVEQDMTRRTLLCMLDQQSERPELRDFKIKPVKIIQENRALYINAVLTVGRAYILARRKGDMQSHSSFGSFEDWSDLVRGAIIWAGRADPLRALEQARARVHFGIILGSFWEIILRRFRNQFWIILGRLLDHFGIISRPLLDDVGIMLESFRDDFGIICQSSWKHYGMLS